MSINTTNDLTEMNRALPCRTGFDGTGTAQNNGRGASAQPEEFRRFGPHHVAYWKGRVECRSYTYEGKVIWLPELYVRLQLAGKRGWFPLGTLEKEQAAPKAHEIYTYLQANGWDATVAKFKQVAKALSTDTGTENKPVVIGEYLKTVQATAKLTVRTFIHYANCFRRIVAGIFDIKDSPAKFDYRTGGNQEWRGKIDTIALKDVTPEAIDGWMKDFVQTAGTSPVAIASAKRSANTYVRCARSLFGRQLLKDPSIQRLHLPPVLPFANVELFKNVDKATRYFSKISVPTLVAAARRELKPKDPEAYKVFLLGLFTGLRKTEIDLCEWRMIDWGKRILHLQQTEYLRLKAGERSEGEIDLDPETLKELKTFKAVSNSRFVITSEVTRRKGKKRLVVVREPRPDSARAYYRCDQVFTRLYTWLRGQGITVQKPLHELRKELGALITTKRGIYAAKTVLRHTEIRTTDLYYAENQDRISVGLGKLLTAPLRASKANANRQ